MSHHTQSRPVRSMSAIREAFAVQRTSLLRLRTAQVRDKLTVRHAERQCGATQAKTGKYAPLWEGGM